MTIKFVKYKLKQIEGVNGVEYQQPACEADVYFSGGIYSDNEYYLGYLSGSLSNINTFISSCLQNGFTIEEINLAQAKDFIESVVSETITTDLGITIYRESVEVTENAQIIIKWRTTPLNMPTLEERLDAIENAIIDIVGDY